MSRRYAPPRATDSVVSAAGAKDEREEQKMSEMANRKQSRRELLCWDVGSLIASPTCGLEGVGGDGQDGGRICTDAQAAVRAGPAREGRWNGDSVCYLPAMVEEGSWEKRNRMRRQRSVRRGARWMDLSGAAALAAAFPVAFSSASSAAAAAAGAASRLALEPGDPMERRCIAAAAVKEEEILFCCFDAGIGEVGVLSEERVGE